MNKRNQVGDRTRKALTWTREGECMRCTSHVLDNQGYPRMRRAGYKKAVRIARLLLIRRMGDIPPSIVSRHICDNKWCIRPDHIIPGTQAQNIQDCVERGRNNSKRGEDSVRSKLTTLQVLQIREAVGTTRAIARNFKISESNIAKIRYRKTWTHI